MFFAIHEIALVLVLIRIDDFPLVGCLVVNPLAVIDCPTFVLKNPVSVLLVLDPLTNVSITIRVIVCAFSVLFAIEPVTLVLLAFGVGIDSEPILAVLLPLALVDSPRTVIVNSSSLLPALYKLPLISFSGGIDVNAIALELVVFPEAHVHVLVRETVGSFTMPAILELADVFGSIWVADFAELRSQVTGVVEKLAQELFLHVCGFTYLFLGALGVHSSGMLSCYHHFQKLSVKFQSILLIFRFQSTTNWRSQTVIQRTDSRLFKKIGQQYSHLPAFLVSGKTKLIETSNFDN